MRQMRLIRGHVALSVAVTALASPFFCREAGAATTLSWKGLEWNVTSGGMAGVAEGNPDNVSVDADGYLHLKITKSGDTWTAAELFTTTLLGFGTYQWQVDAAIDTFDKNVVLGLFPYGPAAGIGKDGTNEIDIEYSRWSVANGPNADWTDYPAAGDTVGELDYTFSLGGTTQSTSRFEWASDHITSSLFKGFDRVFDTTNQLKTWTYAPANPTINIPQQPLPLGMNLWCFQAPPSDGKDVEVVIRDFEFLSAAATVPDAGTTTPGDASTSDGATGSGGTSATADSGASGGGATSSGGALGGGGSANGGATGTGGAATSNGGVASVTGGTANGGAGGGTSTPDAGVASGGGSSSGCGCSVPRRETNERSRDVGALAMGVLFAARFRRRARTRSLALASAARPRMQ